jgi:hypothetical protein
MDTKTLNILSYQIMYHRDQGTEDEVQILANSYAHSINQANQGSKISRDIRGQGIRLRGSSLAYSNLFCRRSRLIHGKTQYLCDFEGNEQRTSAPENIDRRIRLLGRKLYPPLGKSMQVSSTNGKHLSAKERDSNRRNGQKDLSLRYPSAL